MSESFLYEIEYFVDRDGNIYQKLIDFGGEFPDATNLSRYPDDRKTYNDNEPILPREKASNIEHEETPEEQTRRIALARINKRFEIGHQLNLSRTRNKRTISRAWQEFYQR